MDMGAANRGLPAYPSTTGTTEKDDSFKIKRHLLPDPQRSLCAD